MKPKLLNIFIIIILLGIQVGFWSVTNKVTPFLEIVPQVPSLNETKIAALGDEQFYFRFLSLYIQNAGDTFGRFTALKNYNYKALASWLKLLDQLDNKSNFTPAIASYYYSNTQKIEDTRYIIDYLESNYDYNPKEKWWWLGQAVMIANNKLKDKNLALRLAYKLSSTPLETMPRWAQQMPALILEQMGEYEQALIIIKDLAEKYDNYSQGEINFMNYFIRDRLGFLNETIKKEVKYKDADPLILTDSEKKK